MYTIELKAEAAEAALLRLEMALDDPTPVMRDLGELLVESTKKRFGQGVSPEGVKWAPKSPVTLARGGRDSRPLFGPSGALNSTINAEPGRDEVLVGSPMIYAAVQQFSAAKGAFGSMSNGSPIPWGNIPARPYLGISKEDEVNIVETVEDYLTGRLTA